MRITNNMISSNLLINLNNNLTAMSKFNNQISTGKVISRPSDDPVIAAKALKLRTDLSELEQYSKNTNDALSWVDITESAIKEYNSILQRVRELTVSASNGDKTIDDNKKISEEIKQLKEQLISIGNTTYAGRSVFTGFQTDKKLFDENGNYIVNVTSQYINNRKYTNYEVGINEEIRVNTYGIDLFGYVDKNTDLDRFPSGEATGKNAVGGELRAQDEFDFSESFAKLTDETIEITVEGDVFTVPTSELQKVNGETTEKKDIIDILSNATNASGGALKYSADIYFDNDKLVISSRKDEGTDSNIKIEYKGTDRNFVEDVFALDDSIGVGDPAKPAVLEAGYPADLNIDYNTAITTGGESLTINVNGTDFVLDDTALKGIPLPRTAAALASYIENNAKDGGGVFLNTVATVSEDNGKLLIETLNKGSGQSIQVSYGGADPSILEDSLFLTTDSVTGIDATEAVLKGATAIDLADTNPLTDEEMTISFGLTSYTITASEVNALNPVNEANIVGLINGKISAKGSAGLDAEGKIVITSIATGPSEPIKISYTGTDPENMEKMMGLSDGINIGENAVDAVLESEESFGTYKYVAVGEAAKEAELISTSTVDLSVDYSATITDGTISVNVNGTVYTIPNGDISALSAPNTEADILDLFNNKALNGAAPLSTVATASFEDGKLVIKSNNTGSAESIQVSYTGTDASILKNSLYLDDSAAVSGSDATNAVYLGDSAVNLEADFTSSVLSNESMVISVGSTDYTISASEFANLPKPTSISDIENLLGNAKSEAPVATLSSVATVTSVDGKIQITSNTPGDTTPIKVTYIGPNPEELESVMGMKGNYKETKEDDPTKSVYSNMKMFVHLGDDRQEIILGDIPAGASDADIVAEMQNAIDEAFGTYSLSGESKIEVKIDSVTNKLSFSTNNQNDGEIPELFVDFERASESQLFADIDAAIIAMESGDQKGVEEFLGKMDGHLATTHAVWADVGARYNRLELINNRIDTNEVTYTKLLSLNEDVNQSEAIMNFKNQENVYRASLSMGSKIIQPSLVDFIK